MAKMNKKWVVLCSTAIGAIYAAGYFATETQETINQPQQQAHVNTQTESSQSNQQVQTNTQTKRSQTNQQAQANTQTKRSQTNQQAQANTHTKSSQTNRLYKDGTYNGSGSNRRGSIQVAVTIKNDKITDVEISHFGMHYSESDVVGLPGEVLQRQSAQVQNVSGATYSTRAFEDAVQDALSQAHNT